MRNTYLEIDMKKLEKNISNIKYYILDKKIMPVVKAYGYGTYINTQIKFLNKFEIIAVAILDEAIEIRKSGYKNDILVLNPIDYNEIDSAIKNNITISLADINIIKYINKKIKVHIEIETGMNRTGVNINDLDKLIDKINHNKNIIVDGVFTHLSSADYDNKYTLKQLYIFRKAVSILKEEFKRIKYIHSSASNGLINYDDGVSNIVRPGIIMYGFNCFKNCNNYIDIEPICKLISTISFIKEVDKGESIGYARKYKAKKKMKIATIPIGYADGISRLLSNKGMVVIKNKVCNIVGNICMDSMMVDVTNVEVKVGDKVYLWDNEKVKVDDIAKLSNTINYEVISKISVRVPRIFK